MTQNRRRETHEAMVVGNGKVIATGPLAAMRSAAGGGARTIDLDGATVIPGLIDNHPHLHYGGFDTIALELTPCAFHAGLSIN